jgi:hypothetical protein
MSGLLTDGRLVGRVETLPTAPNQPFLKVQGRMFTPMELCALLGAHAGSDVVIELSKPKTEDR